MYSQGGCWDVSLRDIGRNRGPLLARSVCVSATRCQYTPSSGLAQGNMYTQSEKYTANLLTQFYKMKFL